jgi:hypothetical protein
MTTKITDILDGQKVLDSLVRILVMSDLSKQGDRFQWCRYNVEFCSCLTEEFMRKDSITRKAMLTDYITNGNIEDFESFIDDIKEKFIKSVYYNIYIKKHSFLPDRICFDNLDVDILEQLNDFYFFDVFDNRFHKDSFESDYARYLDEVYEVYRKELLKC